MDNQVAASDLETTNTLVVTDKSEPSVDAPEVVEKEPTTETVPVPPVVTVRRDFYQTDYDIVVNILAKNLKPEDVIVEYSKITLKVAAKLVDGSDYNELIPLFSDIDPSKCSYKVLSSKIEIRLRKDSTCTWSSLEARKVEKPTELQPGYPTSSKTKKDWGKVEKEIEKEIPDGEDVNNLFAKIFESGTEETKRAMMKSMQESGGTVLSTNWDEVGKKRVEVSPPDGMEWKKWDDASKK